MPQAINKLGVTLKDTKVTCEFLNKYKDVLIPILKRLKEK